MYKNVYIGLHGCYRTFEKTCEGLFLNLIENNKDYKFDIYINTECIKGYEPKKWDKNDLILQYKYTKEDLDTLFKKCYKSHLKEVTYETLTTPGWFPRVKTLIENYKNNNNKKYDLYIFIRIDCLITQKINLSSYISNLDNNTVKLICRGGNIDPNRWDHNRDWDMGILSKNINNIYTFVKPFYNHYETIIPNNNELKTMMNSIKCEGAIFKLSFQEFSKIEKQYENSWEHILHCRFYIFNKLILPLCFEDNFFLLIIR
jgi:hypothetical protein